MISCVAPDSTILPSAITTMSVDSRVTSATEWLT